MSHPVWYTIRMKMIMKENTKTFKVEFTTAFARSPYVNIILEAKDEHQAKWVARSLCRFGYISNVNDVTELTLADYNETSHAWAYDEDFEIYS